jgi:orotate phosphoribosyltransferase
MGQATVEILHPDTTCLAASGYGGLPLGVIVSQLSGLPLAMVRDSEKNHGKKGLIDGFVPTAQDKVTILDDVYTSGSSLSQTITNLHDTGADILGCHVIVARGDTSKFEFPVSYLLSTKDLV